MNDSQSYSSEFESSTWYEPIPLQNILSAQNEAIRSELGENSCIPNTSVSVCEPCAALEKEKKEKQKAENKNQLCWRCVGRNFYRRRYLF